MRFKIFLVIILILNSNMLFAQQFFILETNKNYNFTINFTSDEIISKVEIEATQNNSIIASTTCNINENYSCIITSPSFSLNSSEVTNSSFSGTLNTESATDTTTTLSFYVINNVEQKKFIDSFSFIIINSLNAVITSTVNYNTSTNENINISGNLSTSTSFKFTKYGTTTTQKAYVDLYNFSNRPSTTISTTSADVRKIDKYAIYWESSGMIENSCSLKFKDYNNNNNNNIVDIISNAATNSVALVTTTPNFYHQYGEYIISCLTSYSNCSINNSVLECESLVDSKESLIYINKEVEWYRCFYGFCISGKSKDNKTPTTKYTFPTFQDCAQKCYLDVKEVAP